jgi:PEP-CTERM motif
MPLSKPRRAGRRLDPPRLSVNSIKSPPMIWKARYIAYARPSSTIPEASTWAMMLMSFAGLGFAGWRARRARAAVVA